MESEQNQKQVLHASHRPLEISLTTQDFHIPTARLRGPGKVENQKQVSHFPTATRDGDPCFLFQNLKPRKEVGRWAASSLLSFQDHSVLETEFGFRIILGLENATPA